MTNLIHDLRKLSKEELLERYHLAVTEFKKVSIDLKSGIITPENINKVRRLRKEIARIKTVLREIELLGEHKDKISINYEN